MGLQLRLWLTVVVLVLAGVLVLLLGTSALYDRIILPFDNVAAQAVNSLKGELVKVGADTVEAATKASVDEPVRAAVKSGQMSPEAEASLLGRAGTTGAPAFALLVKPDGTVGARAGVDVKLEGSVAGLPEFAEAATGVARDGVKVLDGKPWHIASAPVYDAGALAGVILLGWPYDAAFADHLTQQLGTPVILMIKDQRVGDALKNLTDEQVKVRGSSVGEFDLAPLPSIFPLLMEHGRRYQLTAVPVSFSANDPIALVVATDRNEAFRALAWVQALTLAGTLLIAFLQLILILTTLRSVNKPINVIVDHLSQVSQGNSVGILPEAALSGQFLRLGKQVNMILQMMPSMNRPGAPLGALGGAAPNMSSPPVPTPSLGGMGMAGDPLGASLPSLPPSGNNGREPSGPSFAAQGGAALGGDGFDGLGAPAPSLPSTSSPALSRSSPSMAPPSGLSNLFDQDAPDPLAAFRVPPPQPQQAPPHSQPPAPAQQMLDEAEPPPEEPAGALSPEATVMFQVPQELLNQSAQPSTTGQHKAVSAPPSQASSFQPPPTSPGARADDARTVVAQVPQELLSAAAPRDQVSNADEQHYRDVYDKFVETRVQCGEDTSDLTYDRFVAKLLKNRQQIIEKHKAKSVRFQVYVKEGKAALRALPVRE